MMKPTLLAVFMAFAVSAYAENNAVGTEKSVAQRVGGQTVWIERTPRSRFVGNDQPDTGIRLVWKKNIRTGISSLQVQPGASDGDLASPQDSRPANGRHEQSSVFSLAPRAQYLSPALKTSSLVFPTQATHKAGKLGSSGVTGAMEWRSHKLNLGGEYSRIDDIDGSSLTGDRRHRFALGAGVKIANDWTLSGQAGHIRSLTPVWSDYVRNDYGMALDYTVGKWGMSAMYLKAQPSQIGGVSRSDGADQFNIGASYAISQRAKAIATYSRSRGDALGSLGSAYTNTSERQQMLYMRIQTEF